MEEWHARGEVDVRGDSLRSPRRSGVGSERSEKGRSRVGSEVAIGIGVSVGLLRPTARLRRALRVPARDRTISIAPTIQRIPTCPRGKSQNGQTAGKHAAICGS